LVASGVDGAEAGGVEEGVDEGGVEEGVGVEDAGAVLDGGAPCWSAGELLCPYPTLEITGANSRLLATKTSAEIRLLRRFVLMATSWKP
jgi:hypothetical protein